MRSLIKYERLRELYTTFSAMTHIRLSNRLPIGRSRSASWLIVFLAICASFAFHGCRERTSVPVGVTVHVTTAGDDEAVDELCAEPQTEDETVASDMPDSTAVADPPSNPPPDTFATAGPDPKSDDAEPVVADSGDKWNALLQRTRQHLEAEALDEAAVTLTQLRRLEPTPERNEQLAAIQSDLDRRRRSRQLWGMVERLGSNDRTEVLSAQNRLFENADLALPLLRRAIREEDPKRVCGAIEMLVKLRRPDTTMPILVDVLRQPDRSGSWQKAIEAMRASGGRGAGRPLLDLVVTSESPTQRVAALRALAIVVDPPPETLLELLPNILADNAEPTTSETTASGTAVSEVAASELTATLLAANHAVCHHGQHDIASGRGLPVAPTDEQWQQIHQLPRRLTALMENGSDPPAGVARAAAMMAVSTRQIVAAPLRSARVLAFDAEMDNSPAAAVLDGEWDVTTAGHMWRYKIEEQGSIVFDLGSSQTVVGVRIWNLNESSGTSRGWKDVDVYVGSAPAELVRPVAQGITPPAPGKKGEGDYSVTIPVDFVEGRYVRLRAKTTWQRNSHSGLTEVQILGL